MPYRSRLANYARRRQEPVFDPSSLVLPSDHAGIYDFSDSSRRWQDLGKTTPALLPGDPVRAIEGQPHGGLQIPDIVLTGGAPGLVSDSGLGINAGNTAIYRSDIFGTYGILNHSNGVTVCLGAVDSNTGSARLFTLQFSSGTTGFIQDAGGTMATRYGESTLQNPVVPRLDGQLRSYSINGDNSSGKFFVDGAQVGSDFTLSSATTGNSQIDQLRTLTGSFSFEYRKVFFVGRGQSDAVRASLEEWSVS